MIRRIAVIGLGGVGGYFGAKLCKLVPGGDAEVYFVARGPHLESIRGEGLAIRTATEGEWTCRPTLATDRIEELPELDACLVCVKSYDLPGVARALRPKVSEGTLVLPLLNGIDVYERIRAELDSGRVLPGCAYISARLDGPGKVVQEGGACKIQMGPDPRRGSPPPEELLGLFRRCGISCEWQDNIVPALWRKFVFIAGFGLVSAASGMTLGEILGSPRLGDRARTVMEEIRRLASAAKVALPEFIVSESFEKARDFPPSTRTSFQRDFDRDGKPDERDLFGGAVIRLGERLGVATPATRELYEELERRKPWPGQSTGGTRR